jgi:hypothetical protein
MAILLIFPLRFNARTARAATSTAGLDECCDGGELAGGRKEETVDG